MESDLNDESEPARSELQQKDHGLVKENDKSYKCDVEGCRAAFSESNHLHRHKKRHLEKRSHKCTFQGCDKAYTQLTHLKRHQQTHSNIAITYTCEICSVNISTLSNLKRHYNRAHNAERELYCKECNCKFRKKSRFEEHMASHKNVALYKCDKCGKNFLTRIKLNRHQQTHMKSYKCPVENCSEVFGKWAMMIKHKKTQHEMEFVCLTCDKKFSTKARLKSHNKVHTENRAIIPCPYENCNRLYYFKRNLAQHIRNAHENLKFHCDICDLKLSTKQKIKEHIIKIHQTEKKPFKRRTQQLRKDIGLYKHSALSQLTGIQLSASAELQLMRRNPAALQRDKAVEENSSYSEDDRASDVSAKGA